MITAVGQAVQYVLNEGDLTEIDNQFPLNQAAEGEECAALITKVHGPSCVNLHVFLDGETGPYLVTSRTLGDGDGHWLWAPRDPS